MQYLLTPEEYNALLASQEAQRKEVERLAKDFEMRFRKAVSEALPRVDRWGHRYVTADAVVAAVNKALADLPALIDPSEKVNQVR
jgi:hypothetical protein